MKSAKSLTLLFFLLVSVLVSCGGDEWVCPGLCKLDTGPKEVDALRLNIRYEALATGDGVYDEIQYLDNSRPEQIWRTVTEDDLFVPWAIDLVFEKGMQVRIKANGSMQNGTLEVKLFDERKPEGFHADEMCKWMCSM